MRKSEQLDLSFPYDWSNPNIDDNALVINVLTRGIYEDICKVCAHYGLAFVMPIYLQFSTDIGADSSLTRILENIKEGFSRAKTRQPA